MIISIILAVGLVGTLGFVFYQNFIQKKDSTVGNASTNSQNVDGKTTGTVSTTTNTTTPTATTKSTSTTTATPANSNAGYLVLSDWGVKFKLPTTLGSNKVTYYKEQADGGYYAFSTTRVEALGERCSNSSAEGFMPLGIVSRSTTKADFYASATLIGQIDGYYYVYSSTQDNCSGADLSAQTQDTASIQTMLMGAVKN